MELILTILILSGFVFVLSLRFIFGKDRGVCKPGCSNINLFANFDDCPICGESSENHLTKTTK
mgnify:FL=1